MPLPIQTNRSRQTPTRLARNPRLYPNHTTLLQQFVGVAPESRTADDLPVFEELEYALVSDSSDYFAEERLGCHGFPAHQVDIFAGAVVVDVVQSVRVGEPCLVHAEGLGFVVHEGDELKVVEADALEVL